MQQIERYGVIALVFLLVTIVAVSFWGDSKSPGFWSRLTGRGDAKKMEIAKNAATADRAVDNALPLSTNPGAIPNAGPNAIPNAIPNEGAPQGQLPVAAVQPPAQTAESAIANANAPGGAVHVPGNMQSPMQQPMPQPGNVGMQQPAGQAAVAHPNTPIATAIPSATPSPSQQPSALAPAHDAHTASRNTPAVTSSATGSTVEYVVVKGDSLASIAQKNLGSSSRWTEIQALNGGIQPKALHVGTKLKLPATTTAKTSIEKNAPKVESPAAKKAVPAAEPTHAGAVYVVHAGDTLRTIAEKKLGNADRWKDIVAANPGLDPHKLVVGRSLKLPAGEAREASNSGTLVAAAVPAASSASGKPHVR